MEARPLQPGAQPKYRARAFENLFCYFIALNKSIF
jgi:hypothetical protein